MFSKFAQNIEKQFKLMSQYELFEVDIDKNELWKLYLSSFPEETNPIYKERTEHDCNCCKNFIRDVGNVVAIYDGVIHTIWEVTTNDFYNDVAKTLDEYVRSKPIKQPLSVHQKGIGARATVQQTKDGHIKTWNHFFCTVPNKYVKPDPSYINSITTTIQVGIRGFEEISNEVADEVLELIAQGSIYRGEEHKTTLQSFKKLQYKYLNCSSNQEKDIFIWTNYKELGFRIRNTVIGSLLIDLSDGKDLEEAVKAFEVKVAPTNYKRPKALITQGMIKQAMKTIDELGIEESLKRRFAVPEDISVNNVLFVDRSTAKSMKDADSLESLLMSEVKNTKDYSKVEKISINDFVDKVLPTVQSLEVMVENRHKSNLVSLIAPTNFDAPNILKWDNNFTWSYAGEVTDAIKENVKKAGGNVEGVLRFSIQWNDTDKNENDLDAHCKAPGDFIYFGNKDGFYSGTLDVDIITPNGKVAVENIIYTNLNKMPDGEYKFLVHTYTDRGGKDFSAQIEFDGQIFDYFHKGRSSGKIPVATVTKKGNEFTIKHHMSSEQSSKEIWDIKTQQFEPVSMITISPNHWDEQEIGNKHWFFILKNCHNEEQPRGFYNEFLHSKFDKHRKVFEVLASKTKPEVTDNQLSGLGFSSTKRDNLIVKVHGSFTRVLDIQF